MAFFQRKDELPRHINESLCNYLQDEEHLETIAQYLVHNPQTPLKLQALAFLCQENNVPLKHPLHALIFCCSQAQTEAVEALVGHHHTVLWEIRARSLRRLATLKVWSRMDKWLEMQDYLLRQQVDIDSMVDLYELYKTGVQSPLVLESLYNRTPEQLPPLVEFLLSDVDTDAKHAALQYIATEPPDAMFRFCVDEDYTDQNQVHDPLLWELRAMCLHTLRARQIQHERYMEAANVASNCIYDTASGIEKVISGSTAALSGGVLELSELVVQHTEPSPTNFESDAAVQISETTKQVTEKARMVSSSGIQFIKDSSIKQLNNIELQESKTSLQVTSKVAKAALASVAIVGEAVFTNTGVLATCVSQGVSNVISHKYGRDSGTVVKNTADAIGNCIRTVSIFSTDGTKITKTVAKHAAKTSIQQEKMGSPDSKGTPSSRLNGKSGTKRPPTEREKENKT